jgi:glycerol uptake facilitator-like aquaporin
MGRILAESLGTFLLVLVSLMGNNLATAFAYAVALWTLSAAPTGAFNPAATLSLGLRGKLRPKWVAALVVSQFTAALIAAVVTGLLAGHDASRLAEDAPGAVPDAWLGALMAEGMGTAGLTLVLLVTLASRRTAGSTVGPLFAGLALFALLETFRTWMAFMNPAVLLAWGFHDLVSSLRADSVASALPAEALRFGAFLPWAALVMLAQVLGALAGTLLFRLTHPADSRP